MKPDQLTIYTQSQTFRFENVIDLFETKKYIIFKYKSVSQGTWHKGKFNKKNILGFSTLFFI